MLRPKEIKKGLKSPCFAHRHVSRVDHPPPAMRLPTRIATTICRTTCAFAAAVFLPSPSCLMRSYKHCGNAGQGKCGRNLTHASTRRFKHTFEIEAAPN